MRGTQSKALEAILLILFIGLGIYWVQRAEPTRFQNNVCMMFLQHPDWYHDAARARHRWGVPISVQMAIIEQESHFRAKASPDTTSALGYAQAVDSTWHLYLRATHQYSADRASFAAATDFIGWFVHGVHQRLGIPKTDAYAMYLAYHEGELGYRQHSYVDKPWLMAVAKHVQHVSWRYRSQLLTCESQLG